MFLTIITFVIILGLLILVHEIGHFITARQFKVSCPEFGLGLPPRMFGLVKVAGQWKFIKGKTEQEKKAKVDSEAQKAKGGGEKVEKEYENTIWSLNWLPLGGFVNIKGEDGSNRQDPESFGAQPLWKRAIILFSGVGMNFILAMVLFSIGYMIGLPQIIQELELEDGTFKKVLGIGLVKTATLKYPLHYALWEGIVTTVTLMKLIIIAFYDIIVGLITTGELLIEISGPVGIAAVTGQVVDLGFIYVLQFAALLSINLGIINFFPFPALDGGRFIGLLIEGFRGKPNNQKIEAWIHNAGFIALLALFALITYRDIFRFLVN